MFDLIKLSMSPEKIISMTSVTLLVPLDIFGGCMITSVFDRGADHRN